MTTDEPAQWLILARYRVLGELGRGAMGIVYKVHDDRLDRVIALKTIRKDRFLAEGESEHEVLDRFRREARAAGKLSHPGIVTIYDITEDGDDLYIAMEFVDGEPLAERMRATPRIPVAEAARIAMGICDALEYAHAHGVIHRDVKPDNIMCSANGDVTLTDFGIAHIVSSSAAQTGRPRGTPRYMAPERWRGDPVDGRADVYAVGIILYEMLTGCPTFSTKSPSELRELVLHEEPVPPTLVNPALPAAIDPIVRHAIAREPADRYATAGELARALEPFATGASADEGVAAEHAGAPLGLEEAVTVLEPRLEEATASARSTGVERELGAGDRRIGLAAALGVLVLAIAGIWWARTPRRHLSMPNTTAVATAAPVGVARVEATPRPVEATATSAARATDVPTVTAALPTPDVAEAYREASASLDDPTQAEATKLATVVRLANDASDAATDVLLASTRNDSVLVSMAAVKALAGRPCTRVAGPLTALLADEEWQRRAWAAKILGVDGCAGARDALAAQRARETDARVTKLVDDALKMLDAEERDR